VREFLQYVNALLPLQKFFRYVRQTVLYLAINECCSRC